MLVHFCQSKILYPKSEISFAVNLSQTRALEQNLVSLG